MVTPKAQWRFVPSKVSFSLPLRAARQPVESAPKNVTLAGPLSISQSDLSVRFTL
jgi:hypothetical protein